MIELYRCRVIHFNKTHQAELEVKRKGNIVVFYSFSFLRHRCRHLLWHKTRTEIVLHWRKRKGKKTNNSGQYAAMPGLFIPEKSITFISRGEPPAQHDSSGTCSAAGLIKALTTAMTRCSWPLSRCSWTSSCPLFHSATVLLLKKKKAGMGWGGKGRSRDYCGWLFFHFFFFPLHPWSLWLQF